MRERESVNISKKKIFTIFGCMISKKKRDGKK